MAVSIAIVCIAEPAQVTTAPLHTAGPHVAEGRQHIIKYWHIMSTPALVLHGLVQEDMQRSEETGICGHMKPVRDVTAADETHPGLHHTRTTANGHPQGCHDK